MKSNTNHIVNKLRIETINDDWKVLLSRRNHRLFSLVKMQNVLCNWMIYVVEL